MVCDKSTSRVGLLVIRYFVLAVKDAFEINLLWSTARDMRPITLVLACVGSCCFHLNRKLRYDFTEVPMLATLTPLERPLALIGLARLMCYSSVQIWESLGCRDGVVTRNILYKALALIAFAQQGKTVSEKLLENYSGTGELIAVMSCMRVSGTNLWGKIGEFNDNFSDHDRLGHLFGACARTRLDKFHSLVSAARPQSCGSKQNTFAYSLP